MARRGPEETYPDVVLHTECSNHIEAINLKPGILYDYIRLSAWNHQGEYIYIYSLGTTTY